MLNTMSMRNAVLVTALAGVAGVAGAQIITPGPPPVPPRPADVYCTSGPFTPPRGTVSVHLAIDDVPAGPSASVVMRLYDASGNIVASRHTTIAAGHTASLVYTSSGAALLRAQAEVSNLGPVRGRRRRAVGQVELPVDDLAVEVDFQCGGGDDQGARKG